MSFATISPGVMGLDSKYRFRELPVTKDKASPTEYICEFTNPVAASHETGAGGGVSGLDVVFSQVNGVGPSVNGYRPIVKDSTQSFVPTIAFVNAFLTSPDGFSVLYRLKDLDISVAAGNVNILAMLQTNNFAAGGLSLYGSMSSLNRRGINFQGMAFSATDGIGLTLSNSDKASSNPADPRFMIMVSNDYKTRTAIIGILAGDTQPTKLSDFLCFSMVRGDAAFVPPPAATAWYGVRNSIIGTSGDYANGALGVKVGSITCAKYPCFVPV